MKHTQLTTDLFHDLIDPCLSAIDICAKHDLTIEQLTDLIDSPEYRTAVEQLAHIEQTRIESTAPLRRRLALQVLQNIAQQEPTTPTHTETVRKAAAHLARISQPESEPEATQADTTQTTPARNTDPRAAPSTPPSDQTQPKPPQRASNHAGGPMGPSPARSGTDGDVLEPR